MTGDGRLRLDIPHVLSDVLAASPSLELKTSNVTQARGDTWVYFSGPNAFIEAGASACKDIVGMEWHSGKFESCFMVTKFYPIGMGITDIFLSMA